MKEEKQYTINEHYVPQAYLSNFKGEKGLFKYQKEGRLSAPAKVKEECVKENLYEFFDESGVIIYRNTTERLLGRIESLSSRLTKLIITLAQKETPEGLCCIAPPQMCALYYCMAVQTARLPVARNIFEASLRRSRPNSSEAEINNELTLNTTGFWSYSDGGNLIESLCEKFKAYKLLVCASKEPLLITSDRPVVITSNEEALVYALNPNVCIVGIKRERPFFAVENRYHSLTKDEVKWINREIFQAAFDVCYANTPFDINNCYKRGLLDLVRLRPRKNNHKETKQP